MKGRPNNGTLSAPGQRCYDEALIRRLVAEGKTQAKAARLVGCSDTTVFYALHPHRRKTADSRRPAHYRAKTIKELEQISDFHFEHVELHQALLDAVEDELARRRKAARNGDHRGG